MQRKSRNTPRVIASDRVFPNCLTDSRYSHLP